MYRLRHVGLNSLKVKWNGLCGPQWGPFSSWLDRLPSSGSSAWDDRQPKRDHFHPLSPVLQRTGSDSSEWTFHQIKTVKLVIKKKKKRKSFFFLIALTLNRRTEEHPRAPSTSFSLELFASAESVSVKSGLAWAHLNGPSSTLSRVTNRRNPLLIRGGVQVWRSFWQLLAVQQGFRPQKKASPWSRPCV